MILCIILFWAEICLSISVRYYFNTKQTDLFSVKLRFTVRYNQLFLL